MTTFAKRSTTTIFSIFLQELYTQGVEKVEEIQKNVLMTSINASQNQMNDRKPMQETPCRKITLDASSYASNLQELVLERNTEEKERQPDL